MLSYQEWYAVSVTKRMLDCEQASLHVLLRLPPSLLMLLCWVNFRIKFSSELEFSYVHQVAVI